MADEFALDFHATTRGLQAALEAIDTTCATWQTAPDAIARARIVLEELFTNTVKYGYGGEYERPVRLRMTGEGRALRLIYEDEAPMFDPTLWKPRQVTSSPLENTREGLAGIAMVRGLSKTVEYVRLPNGNRITLMLRSDDA
jgi:serine/threonine-protein kinase RsbW